MYHEIDVHVSLRRSSNGKCNAGLDDDEQKNSKHYQMHLKLFKVSIYIDLLQY
jgi:hypothetical protein